MSDLNVVAGKWTPTTLGELFDFKGGGTPNKKNPSYWGGDIPWASVKDIKSQYLTNTIDRITQQGLKESAANLAHPGELVLLTRIEPGKASIVKTPVAVNQDCKIVSPKDNVDVTWAYYLFRSIEREFIKRSSGTTVLGIRLNDIKEISVALPSLEEQKGIVAKIETLFSELDKGIEFLKTARQQLKAYRQAVLKHAFEGKLTEQWRQQNPDKLENPEQLLARIQQEREQRYRQQLEKWKQTIEVWKESGKEGKKPSKPKKARGEPEPFVDEIEVPPLWGVTTVGALNVDVSDGPFGSNLKSSDYVDHGVRVIRLENVGYMEFIEDKHSYVTEEKYEKLKKHTVSGGDLIFSSFITEGVRTVILPEKIDRAINKADCFCIRVHGRLYLTEFLAWFLSSRSAYKQVESEIHGIGRPRINTTQLKRFTIPICSIDEQKEVVSKINAILSDTDHMEETLDNEVQRAEALRQSILKKPSSDSSLEVQIDVS